LVIPEEKMPEPEIAAEIHTAMLKYLSLPTPQHAAISFSNELQGFVAAMTTSTDQELAVTLNMITSIMEELAIANGIVTSRTMPTISKSVN
jgi:hypothetical protein